MALLLSLFLASPAAAAPAVFGTLDRLALDIRGAMAHVARLRDRLDERLSVALSGASPAAEVAGIADGRFGSTVASLRWASRGLDRRLALLRATVGTPESPEMAEILLVMRVELSSLLWTIEELGGSTAEVTAPPSAAERAVVLDQLNASLEQLAIATSAMAGFDWGRASTGATSENARRPTDLDRITLHQSVSGSADPAWRSDLPARPAD